MLKPKPNYLQLSTTTEFLRSKPRVEPDLTATKDNSMVTFERHYAWYTVCSKERKLKKQSPVFDTSEWGIITNKWTIKDD